MACDCDPEYLHPSNARIASIDHDGDVVSTIVLPYREYEEVLDWNRPSTGSWRPTDHWSWRTPTTSTTDRCLRRTVNYAAV